MVLGEHLAPVRSAEPAPEFMKTLFFSLVMSLTAKAADEVGTSTIRSTPSVSYH